MNHVFVNASTGEVNVVPLTQEEIDEAVVSSTNEAWIDLRAERNRRLAASDWTQVSDAPVDQSAWSTYRQALRDLPANTSDPFEPVWPTKPT